MAMRLAYPSQVVLFCSNHGVYFNEIYIKTAATIAVVVVVVVVVVDFIKYTSQLYTVTMYKKTDQYRWIYNKLEKSK